MAKFKTDTERILEAISNNGTTFSEFCQEYDGTPERGDKEAWATLFDKLEALDNIGHIEIDRGDDNRIHLLTLTESGTTRLKQLQWQAF